MIRKGRIYPAPEPPTGRQNTGHIKIRGIALFGAAGDLEARDPRRLGPGRRGRAAGEQPLRSYH